MDITSFKTLSESKHATLFTGMCVVLLTHRQCVLGDDDSYIIDDEAVPHEQACTGGFDHQPPTIQQEEKAGQEIAQAEHADPCGARHKQHG